LGNPIIPTIKIILIVLLTLLLYSVTFGRLEAEAPADVFDSSSSVLVADFSIPKSVPLKKAPSVVPYVELPMTEARTYAKEAITAKWGEGEWEYFDLLIRKESGWNHLAQNPNSSAFGLAQFLNSTWASVGCQKTVMPETQIDCAIKYVEANYGTPSKAIDFHTRMNWY